MSLLFGDNIREERYALVTTPADKVGLHASLSLQEEHVWLCTAIVDGIERYSDVLKPGDYICLLRTVVHFTRVVQDESSANVMTDEEAKLVGKITIICQPGYAEEVDDEVCVFPPFASAIVSSSTKAPSLHSMSSDEENPRKGRPARFSPSNELVADTVTLHISYGPNERLQADYPSILRSSALPKAAGDTEDEETTWLGDTRAAMLVRAEELEAKTRCLQEEASKLRRAAGLTASHVKLKQK